MYVSVLVLEPVEKPLNKEEIEELKYTEDQLSELKNYIPNICELLGNKLPSFLRHPLLINCYLKINS